MNEEMHNAMSSTDSFAFGKKWFWIGVVMALNPIAGTIYGAALLFEPKHRKEGLAILAVTLIWGLIAYYYVGPWLIKVGGFPKIRAVQ